MDDQFFNYYKPSCNCPSVQIKFELEQCLIAMEIDGGASKLGCLNQDSVVCVIE